VRLGQFGKPKIEKNVVLVGVSRLLIASSKSEDIASLPDILHRRLRSHWIRENAVKLCCILR